MKRYVSWNLNPRSWAAAASAGVVLMALNTGAHAAPTPDEVVKHYAVIVDATYSDLLRQTKALQTAVDALIAAPSEQALQTARQAWVNAREIYGQSEAFRFYGGPIDGRDGPEGRINSWPMDESFVDGVKGKPTSGLINNPRFKINAKNLSAMNERGGEENIATGWHAIEFLLWGQDFNPNGPGDRSFEDFVDGRAPHADRRRLYLKTVMDLLVNDLTQVQRAWQPGGGNYRAKFEQEGLESVRKMLVGIGSLSRGELAGERMEVALASQDQEDEQSCFSDNTHRDIVNDAIGIQNVWTGHYRTVDGQMLEGPSLKDWVDEADAAVSTQLTQQIEQSVQAAQEIPPPFDQALLGGSDAVGRQKIQATVDSVIAQSKLIVGAANAIGIKRLTLVKP